MLLYISRRLRPPQRNSALSPEQQEIFDSWFRDQGDKSLRLNYDLDRHSMVFDLGGYEGQWTSDIVSKYGCSVHVFEPVAEFADRIVQRFHPNPKITVHKYGLASENNTARLTMDDDASSAFTAGEHSTEIRLVKAADFFSQHHITTVDLMKINIEGGEYDLLEHLIESGLIANIKNIQVQFHDLVPNAPQRMRKIQSELEKTHLLTYQYPFVWENWERKRSVGP